MSGRAKAEDLAYLEAEIATHFGRSKGYLRVGGDVEVELEAVVGEADVGRQRGVGGGVVEVVRHVGEEGTARLDFLDQGDGVVQSRVGGMGLAAERVENEDVEAGEQGKARGGDVAEVGEVGC